MQAERIKIDDGTKTYEIVDQDNKVRGTFKFNPSDTNILRRYDEVVEELEKVAEEMNGTDKTTETQKELEKKVVALMDYLVKGDMGGTFFKINGPLTPMDNGDLFVVNVLESIGAIIEKETKKRIKKVDSKASKYLAAYK